MKGKSRDPRLMVPARASACPQGGTGYTSSPSPPETSMRPLTFAAVVFVVAIPACRRAPDKDLEAIQGDWQMVQVSNGGKDVPAGMLTDKKWRFEGKKLIPLDNKDDVATITLDSGKSPAAIDIVDKAGARDE